MFMLKSTHEAAVRELKAKAARDIEPLTREIEAYKEGAKALHSGIDDAAAENQRLAESLRDMEADRGHWREQAMRDEADAQKWRDRAERDRNRVRKTPKPAPKKS